MDSSSANDSVDRHPLCRSCSKIDFEAIVSDPTTVAAYYSLQSSPKHNVDVYSEDLRWERPIWSRSGWDGARCPICRVLGDFCSAASFPKYDGRYAFLRVATNNRPWTGLEPTPIFALFSKASRELLREPGAFVALQRTSARRFERMNPQVNFDRLKNWVQACQEKHEGHCFESRDIGGGLGASIHPRRFIDCTTRYLVENNKNMTYAILSYVWGLEKAWMPTIATGTALPRLPRDLPKTIEDAIKVAAELGIRYLWVDRYCINQRDADEVAIQTALMHHIYGDSAFTIIAAAGSAPNYGLPGVSSLRSALSTPQGAKWGDFEFQPVPWDMRKLLSTCKWASRGWTFQEQRCSSRRFYFSDFGVYYSCDASFGLESGLFETHSISPDFPILKDHEQRPARAKRLWAAELITNLREYSTRQLTRQEDILRAILGVLGKYESGNEHRKGVPSHHGIPLFPHHYDFLPLVTTMDSETKSPLTYTASFFYALGWAFHIRNPSWPLHKRRKGFRSWSWAGWEAPVGHFLWEREKGQITLPSNVGFGVETITGEVLDFEHVLRMSPLARQTTLSNFVHLTTWVTPVWFEKIPDSNRVKVYAKAVNRNGDHGYRVRFELMPDTTEPLLDEGLMLHLVELEGEVTAALVIPKMNGLWERVGYYKAKYAYRMELSQRNYEFCFYGVSIYDFCFYREWRTIRLG